MKKVYFFAGIMALFLMACEHDPPEPLEPEEEMTQNSKPCDPDSVYYSRDIDRLLTSSCAYSGCHDQVSRADNIDITSYSALIQSNIVDPFDADGSKIIEVILETDSDKVMPPPGNTRLTDAQLDLLKKWINQGALNNSCTDTCDVTNVTYSMNVKPILERSCKGCHSNQALGGGVFLRNYDEVSVMVQNDRLLGAIKHLDGFNAMPFGQKKLPTCEINQIEIWINNGAKDD